MVEAVAVRRDRAAFARLFDFYAPRLQAYLLRLRLDSDAAEEVTQDVMTTLWRKAGQFDRTKSSVSTWLFRIAHNRRIDRLRRDRPNPVDDVTAFDAVDPTPPADAALDLAQRQTRAVAALKHLPPDQRDVIRLAFFEGMSHSDIAAKTGLPIGTVKSRLRLAFTRLRQALETVGVNEPA